MRLGVVRETANEQDHDLGIADTESPAGSAARSPAVAGRNRPLSTPRGIVSSRRFSPGVPPCRSRRYWAKRSVTARTIVATALEVQIKASCGSNGAVTNSQSCFTAFAVQSVWVTPESVNEPAPSRWRAQAYRESMGNGK